MKLRTRIFLTFSVLATIPLVIFTVFCYKRYTETTYDRIDVISSHLFENAQKTANDTLNKVRQTAGTFNFYYNDGSSIISDLKKFKDPDSPPDTYEYFKIRTSTASISLLHPAIFSTVQTMTTEHFNPTMISRILTGIRIRLLWTVHSI